jgi:hypothetical protein
MARFGQPYPVSIEMQNGKVKIKGEEKGSA